MRIKQIQNSQHCFCPLGRFLRCLEQNGLSEGGRGVEVTLEAGTVVPDSIWAHGVQDGTPPGGHRPTSSEREALQRPVTPGNWHHEKLPGLFTEWLRPLCPGWTGSLCQAPPRPLSGRLSQQAHTAWRFCAGHNSTL